MLRSISMALVASLAACGFSLNPGSSIDAMTGDATGGDADVDASDALEMPVDAMPDMAMPGGWTTPQSLGISGVDDPTLSGDLLHIWFIQAGDIYHASRTNVTQAFGTATKVDELSSLSLESTPEVSTDGQTITFARLVGNNDIYMATWNAIDQRWNAPEAIDELNTTDHDQAASISSDGSLLAMTRNPLVGSPDIYYSTRSTPSSAWSTPSLASELNSVASDNNVSLSGDKLTICFDSLRASSANDIYCATRASALVPFDTPAPMTAINSMQNDSDPWISPDGALLIFWSDRDGTGRLYFSRRN